MESCRAITTPLDHGIKLSKEQQPQTEVEQREMASIPFKSAVGSLIYAMLGTRPDLASAVGLVSLFMANPGQQHWQAVKRILRYLQGTLDLGLHLGGTQSEWELTGYSDADWGGNPDDRKSTTGFLFLLGGPISWQSKKQPSVALSSTEAEYMALTQAARRLFGSENCPRDLKQERTTPTTLFGDNQGALALSSNPTHHSRSKHIDIRHHFIRETVEDNKITLVYCNTDDMVADIVSQTSAWTQVYET